VKLRRLIIATHRDIGYFFAGLTALYAISGVAVNHIDDWNPNYVIRREVVKVGVLPFFLLGALVIFTSSLYIVRREQKLQTAASVQDRTAP